MSNQYCIYIGYKRFDISGVEAAWDAYNKAIAFAEAVGEYVDLADAETLEVLASTWEAPKYEPDLEDDLDDCEEGEDLYPELGFDPYAGGYTFDC